MPPKLGSRDLDWIEESRTRGIEPTEYFCHGCGQLMLNVSGKDVAKCGDCGSSSIIKGAIGELDKNVLKEEFANAS